MREGRNEGGGARQQQEPCPCLGYRREKKRECTSHGGGILSAVGEGGGTMAQGGDGDSSGAVEIFSKIPFGGGGKKTIRRWIRGLIFFVIFSSRGKAQAKFNVGFFLFIAGGGDYLASRLLVVESC